MKPAPKLPSLPVVSENPSLLDNPILDTFLAYWNLRRGDRPMPSRADINPTDVKAWLGWLCFVEALPGFDDFRFRLIGSRVAEYLLGDATGLTVREAYAAANASRGETELVLAILRKTCTSHYPVRVTGESGEWRGRFYPDFDVLYMPLSDDGTTANMLMGGFAFNYRAYLNTRMLSALTRR